MTYKVDQSPGVSDRPEGVIVSVKPHGGGLVFRTIEETCNELNRLESLVDQKNEELKRQSGFLDHASVVSEERNELFRREGELINVIVNLAAKLNE